MKLMSLRKFLAFSLVLISTLCHGQSAIVRGEVSAGVYENIGSTSQRLNVNIAGSTGSSQVVIATPTKNSYVAAAGGIVLAASATDVCELRSSGNLAVWITKVTVGGIQTTTGTVDFYLIKRSTFDTAGTATAMTRVAMGATGSQAGVTANSYTANPTPGTTTGNIAVSAVPLFAAASPAGSPLQTVLWQAGVGNTQPIRLVGSGTQSVVVNLNGVTVTGGTINCNFEWYEE